MALYNQVVFTASLGKKDDEADTKRRDRLVDLCDRIGSNSDVLRYLLDVEMKQKP